MIARTRAVVDDGSTRTTKEPVQSEANALKQTRLKLDRPTPAQFLERLNEEQRAEGLDSHELLWRHLAFFDEVRDAGRQDGRLATSGAERGERAQTNQVET
jgi:hypothetical protein